jgi:protein dithiol oxidoreductase (disulfide-forming)
MRRRWRTGTLAACIGIWATLAPAHKDHTKVDKLPQAPLPVQRTAPGKVEVVEYFWYGSAQANELEPALAAWAAALPKDVVFRREHVLWGGRSDVDTHARLFATLRTMKIDEVQLRAILAAYHEQGNKLVDDGAVLAWVGTRGIDPARFAATYRSRAVDAQMTYAKDSTSFFVIETVPTFVINNQHVISAYHATGRPDGVLALVDERIARERARVKPAKSKSAPAH